MQKKECPFRVGDIVRFKDKEISDQTFTVEWVHLDDGDGPTVDLEELPMYGRFLADNFELVKECPYKDGEEVALKSVYWNSESNHFVIYNTVGTFNENRGYFDFKKRTMDCFGVPCVKIGKMYDREQHSNDYDVVFCLPTDEAVTAAKKVWEQVVSDRIEELEEKLLEMKKSRAVLRNNLDL